MTKEKYITEPRVYLVGQQHVETDGLNAFLDDEGLRFETDTKVPAEVLAEAAGRTCYMSFGKGRKTNAEYLDRIISSHHGSVLEHAVWNFLVTGISRSLTHELIRHRAGFGYCLDGDTLIYSEHYEGRTVDGKRKKNGTKKRRIEDLYRMKETSHGRSRMKLLRLRCLDERSGHFVTGKVRDVVCSGKKHVFSIRLKDGKSITCSKDHRFLTPSGWRPLHEITGGLDVSSSGYVIHGELAIPVMVNGIEAYKERLWLKKHYHSLKLEQEQIAAIAGVSKHTIRSWIRKHGLQKPAGSWARGRIPWNKGRKYRAGWTHSTETKKRLSELKQGGRNPQWRGGITRSAVSIRQPINHIKGEIFERDGFACRMCGQHSKKLTVHHVMPIWAAPHLAHERDNMVTLCSSCHRAINGRELEYVEKFGKTDGHVNIREKNKGGGNLLIPRPVKIASIEYVGERMTYDIEMEGRNHNFVANGFVTHNSQLSQRYVDESEARYVVPPMYRDHPDLLEKWKNAMDAAHQAYLDLVEATEPYVAEQYPELARTERRKIVRQSARSVLPNACETKIFISANARALRHFFEMRGSPHADTEIRELAVAMCRLMKEEAPNMFSDLEIVLEDGMEAIAVTHSKV